MFSITASPAGFRIATKHPDRITAIISQNGNAYEEGLSEGWSPIRAYWQDPSQANREALRACLAGWLGGLAPIKDFNPLLQMASGVYLTFFGSFVFGEPGFPLSDVPLQEIAQQVASGRLKAKPSRVFAFEEIHEAHRVMEANEARGKMVVVRG
jgi:NADPH:quinone reductase-like Zn-dependent oxidoreductase